MYNPDSLISTFDINANFWKLHPQFKIVEGFSELYEKDHTKNKGDSSSLMWAIAFFLDQSPYNKYKNLQTKDREFIIAKDILKNPKFKFDSPKVQPYVELYSKLVLSPAQRALNNWKIKLEERDQFIADTPYTLDTAEQLDKIIANTPKHYDNYYRILDELTKEDSGNKNKGGRVDSLSDSGKI